MKNIIALFALALYSSSNPALSQTAELPDTTPKKSYIGFNISYISSYAKFIASDGEFYESSKMAQSFISPGNYKGASLNIVTSISERFRFETGLSYSESGYRLKDVHLSDENGEIISTGIAVIKRKHVGIPLEINYVSKPKKFQLLLGIGFSIDALVAEKSMFKASNNIKREHKVAIDTLHNRVEVTPFISAGALYNLNESWFLKVEPQIGYGIRGYYNDDPKIQPHTLTQQINLGLYKKLK